MVLRRIRFREMIDTCDFFLEIELQLDIHEFSHGNT